MLFCYDEQVKVFVAASYSSKVDYSTGDVYPNYKEWLEGILKQIESYGYEVFCALRADNWRINDIDPAQAFKLDEAEITSSDAMLAIVNSQTSAGVQMEIGMAIALKKKVVIAHEKIDQLAYFNKAVVSLGQAKELILPIEEDPFSVKS